MVGVYCTFLGLDLQAFRRTENIQILSVFPKRADLASVLNIISEQMSKLAEKGVAVVDLTRGRRVDSDSKEQAAVRSDECIETAPGIKPSLRFPFMRKFPRAAYSSGDAVNQAVLGGGRAVWSTFLCRMCFGNMASNVYRSNLYKLKHQVLEHNFCKSRSVYLLV
jgi:hypothetical protein